MTEHTWPDYDKTVDGQRRAADPGQSAWVSANAGSGKTKVLIDRVARLLLKGVKPDQILCVTYTKAAASEMQARLFKRLGGWCVADDEKLAEELEELEQDTDAIYDETRLGQARTLFAHALETPGGLRIETIHAFCGRLLRRFPLEAGVAPGFQEIDEVDSAILWERAMAHLGAQATKAHLSDAIEISALAAGGNGISSALQTLRANYAAVEGFIRHHGGVDGAVEALREVLRAPQDSVIELIEHGMGPALPVGKLREMVGVLLGGAKTDVKSGEVLEFVLSDAPAEERYKAYLSFIRTGSGGERKSDPYTKTALKLAPQLADLFQIKSIPEGEETFRLKALDTAVRARRIFDKSAALLRLSNITFSDYEARKKRRAALDFDDLITSSADLLNKKAASEWVLWKLEGGLTHVLLDEAQDTSPDQWRLLNKLTEDFFSGQGVERELARTLFVVGDEKQSIYSFQGADPEQFLEEKRSFGTRPNTDEPVMQMSFRSAPEVLSFVDAIFSSDHFGDEAPFSTRTPESTDIVEHLPFRRDHKGCVELWPLEPPEAREDETPWDAPRGQQSEASPKAKLANRIAAWAATLIRGKQGVWSKGKLRPARPGDFLILVRGRTGGLFDAIIKALKREGLPVAGADRIDLLDSLPVQDLLNLIRFVLCPEDDLALAEILTGPFGELNEDEHLFGLAYGRGAEPLWTRVQQSKDADIQTVATFLGDCLRRRDQPAFEFLTHALEHAVHDGQTGWDLIQARLGSPAREPIIALLDRAAGFDASHAPSLQLFLDAIERQGGDVKRELSGPQDEVRVMTVHGAKGLEAPIVIVPDTTSAPKTTPASGLLVRKGDCPLDPNAGAPIWAGSSKDDCTASAELRAQAEARDVRESRRLLYVALTRAEDRLLVCGAWTGGAKSKTGHHERSWYAACAKGMSALNADTLETPQGPVLRYGEPGTATIETPAKKTSSKPALDWLKIPAKRESSAARYAAPSTLIGDEPAVLAPFTEKADNRLARGRLIHTLLQTLPELPREDWEKRALHFLSREKTFSSAEQKEMMQAALDVLESPIFQPLFGPGSRAEAPIVGGNDERLPKGMRINGRIDRLVVSDHEVKIIDYKTDRPAPARAEDMGETYTAQMAAYRAVMEAAYPDRTIRCAIVWTDGAKLMEIPAELMDAALVKLQHEGS